MGSTAPATLIVFSLTSTMIGPLMTKVMYNRLPLLHITRRLGPWHYVT